MRRWFLSYHTPDEALAERLKAAIERRDDGAIVFFAPANLRAGVRWAPALAEAIAEATAFVLLVTERGIGRWQEIEYEAAFDKHVNSPDFPIVLMLLEGHAAPRLAFLKQLHWIVTPDPASEKDVARLIEAVVCGRDARPGERWRYTIPYRGLSAMEEKDSDYFFGRERETVEALNVLAKQSGRLPVLLGNSGVGKSSLAQAGVMAALRRQAWPETAGDVGPWPPVFQNSRQWCFLTMRPGPEPIKALVEAFLENWQFDAGNPVRIKRRNEWMELLLDDKKKTNLSDLLDETGRRHKGLNQPEPPAFFLYIDQGEELYSPRTDERQRRRFSEILAHGLADQRLRALMSARSDFLGALQADEPLFDARRQIDVPPLREPELREVVSRPAALLSARFEPEALAADIARRTAEESAKDAGALPLLSYLLDDMWTEMVKRGDGKLRLPAAAIELGRVLVERADAFLAHHPESEEALRRLLTLKLADVREDGEPTKRRAPRSEFSDDEWRLVSELAGHPNRLVVTATFEAVETYAEVAHEAVFRRWQKLRDWIAAEREFLVWRSGLETARRSWQAAPERSRTDALLMGLPLAQAKNWLTKRREDLSVADRAFVDQSVKAQQRRRWQAQALVAAVAGAIAMVGWVKHDDLIAQWRKVTITYPYMLTQVRPLKAEEERALKPGDSFRECANAKNCPEMVVVPAGGFIMGSPASEQGRADNEEPQHKVVFARPFAVARFDVTFDDWDACADYGPCPRVSDSGYGRGRQPVINVTWDDARHYAAWLSRMTGKPYRLLSEAEFEYAARAGTRTAYPWGDEIGKNNANCNACGSQWDNRQPSPVDSFAGNPFGLHDMHGNVWQWTEDCYHGDYQGAPQDGSAWIEGADCSRRVVRGGCWRNDPRGNPRGLRSAFRDWIATVDRGSYLGFRVGRTLSAGAGAITVAPGAH
jgi:formylglycine-generating enzyme required for sulfatase activity